MESTIYPPGKIIGQTHTTPGNTAASEFAAAPEAGQDFYNWVINKPAGEVVLKSKLAVSGTATFAKGLVHSGHLGGLALTASPASVLIFRDNATAVGASNGSFVTHFRCPLSPSKGTRPKTACC